MAPLAMTEEGCPCEELSGSVIAGAFWVCHCGGLSLVCHCEGLFCLVIARSEATKQSRFSPRDPLSLLRFARKDRRGRRPLRLLRFARNDEKGEGPLRLLRCARKDKTRRVIARAFLGLSLRGSFFLVIARSIATKQSRLIPRRSPPGGPSDCFAPLATTEGEGGP